MNAIDRQRPILAFAGAAALAFFSAWLTIPGTLRAQDPVEGQFVEPQQAEMVQPQQGQMVEPLYYEEPSALIKEPGPMAPDVPLAVTAMPLDFNAGTPNTFRSGLYPTLPKRGWPLHFGVRAGVMWDDNIMLDEDGKSDDFVFTVAPIVIAELGRGRGGEGDADYAIRLSYSPQFLFFMDHPEEDTISHDVDIDLSSALPFSLELPKTTIRTRVGLHTGGGGDIRIGDRVEQTEVNASIVFEHYLTGKMTLTGGVGTAIEIFEEDPFHDSNDVRGDLFLNYEVFPKMSLGIGFGVGYAKQDEGEDQIYYQPMVQVRYQMTGKLTMGLMGGVELRDIDGYGTETSPIFGGDINWAVREGTSIALTGYRRIRPSVVFADQNYTATGAALSIRQRLWRRYYLTLTTGYEYSEYTATAHGVDATRDDDFWYVRLNLDVTITDWWSVGAFVEHRENDNNLSDAYSFDNNRAGIYSAVMW